MDEIINYVILQPPSTKILGSIVLAGFFFVPVIHLQGKKIKDLSFFQGILCLLLSTLSSLFSLFSNWQVFNAVTGAEAEFLNHFAGIYSPFFALPIGGFTAILTTLTLVASPHWYIVNQKEIHREIVRRNTGLYARYLVWRNRWLIRRLRRETNKLGLDEDSIEACKKAIGVYGLDRNKQNAMRVFLKEAVERLEHFNDCTGCLDKRFGLSELEPWFNRNAETICSEAGVQVALTDEDELYREHEEHLVALQTQRAQAR